MRLRLTGSDLVHLDRNTFMWVQLTEFAFDGIGDDATVLAELIASRHYAHDYASPFRNRRKVSEPAVHGRWWRSSIDPGRFERVTANDAEAILDTWANHQDWTTPGYRQPEEVELRLRAVYALLRSGDLYVLQNPPAEHEHDYGFVTGEEGFHEFIVIDRSQRRVTVVVASDD